MRSSSVTIREFGGIHVDTRDWPIIVWESPESRVPDTASAEALGWVEELWKRTPAGAKSFMLTDLSRMKEAAPASQRKYAADFMERNRALKLRASVGGAIVATSAIVRGLITAVFWLRPSPVETRVVTTRKDGLLLGLGLLEASCPPLPTNLLLLRTKLLLD